jgi:hypothetical protein
MRIVLRNLGALRHLYFPTNMVANHTTHHNEDKRVQQQMVSLSLFITFYYLNFIHIIIEIPFGKKGLPMGKGFD